MPGEPRTIKGPCFDECAHGWVPTEDGAHRRWWLYVVQLPTRNPGRHSTDAQARTRRPAAKRAAEDDVMMTDEQYIDDLFVKEPCGYQDTPGFRDFLLGWS